MLTREDVIVCLKAALHEAERNGLPYKVALPEDTLQVALYAIHRKAASIERDKQFAESAT